MINNKIKKKKNIRNSKFTINAINNNNSKSKIYNQDLMLNDSNHNIDIDKIAYKHFKTISFSHKNEDNNKNLEEQNKKKLIFNKTINDTKESLFEDKLIQTNQNFYSINDINLNLNDNFYIQKKLKIKKEKIYNLNDRYSNNTRVFSGIKYTNFANNYFKNLKKLNDSKTSRNELYVLINKQKESAIKTYFQNLNLKKENNSNNSNNNKIEEKKRKHRNLLTIENIYSQRKISQKFCKTNEDDKYKRRIQTSKLSNLKKKYSINEIKFPLKKNINKRYLILNDNNDHLIEEIFKRQTTSNFNNKYTLKYKTNDSIKKENIKDLFSLLKKYKNSDEDK